MLEWWVLIVKAVCMFFVGVFWAGVYAKVCSIGCVVGVVVWNYTVFVVCVLEEPCWGDLCAETWRDFCGGIEGGS